MLKTRPGAPAVVDATFLNELAEPPATTGIKPEEGRVNLLDFSPSDLEAYLTRLGKEKFRARQLMLWIYDRGITDFGQMSNLAKGFREGLAELAEIRMPEEARREQSVDGTTKFLFRMDDGEFIESVLIPEDDRMTLCVSSQAGCAMACEFCLTARMGLRRNLKVWEILGQVLHVKLAMRELFPERRLSNIVFMGMGEPLQNLEKVAKACEVLTDDFGFKISARKVTVSTVGLVPQIRKFGQITNVNLAVSLNATTDKVRDRIMPINRKWPIARLIEALREVPLDGRRKITIEYVMLKGLNDTLDDARRLAALLADIPCKINLLPWNPFPGPDLETPEPAQVQEFQNYLIAHHMNARVRTPRGRDISAACGMLKGIETGKVKVPR
ncbi:MAG: 23S rRNA (adenine(2503)-C(2))-methyltransferase RlmN [Deltaproteobacteria bacterium]|nr:23S rRNA (adenine(2503)-C(2))-methyltransferase RlmN [Deltaproteobacteria bacterium]